MEILEVIAELLETSTTHKVSQKDGRYFLKGELVSSILGSEQLVLNGAILTIDKLQFDLSDPKSISDIENLFGCSRSPEFDEITEWLRKRSAEIYADCEKMENGDFDVNLPDLPGNISYGTFADTLTEIADECTELTPTQTSSPATPSTSSERPSQ